MWTGRQTLGEIDRALSKLRGEEGRLDGALASASATVERLRRDRAEALKELARVKLDEITAGRLSRNLDASEQRALQILESRRLRIENLGQQIELAIKAEAAAEVERDAAAAEVERAVDAVEKVRIAAEAQVHATLAWADANKSFAALDAIAGEAEKKAAQSESELREKQKPYDADVLFAYLWRNGYGTSRYASSAIVRMIDQIVADFIGFDEVRASYAMLIEIPVRLREHASLQRAAADKARAEVAGLERQAMLDAGIEPLERQLAEARHKLAAADAAAERKRNELKDLEGQRASLTAAGNDTAYTQAIETISEGDAQDDIATLVREAQRTGTPTDDMIVRRISGLDERIEAAEKEAAGLRATARDLAGRRGEVEKVRDRFRTSGFDHPNATFRNENDIGRVLGQILEGAVRSGILWDILRGGFGTRPQRGRPDFGAPSFPFPFPMPGGGEGARGGEWREPGTRGGWQPPFDFGSGAGGSDRSNDDDNFSTGGSF